MNGVIQISPFTERIESIVDDIILLQSCNFPGGEPIVRPVTIGGLQEHGIAID